MLFGTAGNPQNFYEEGYKASEEMPGYLAGLGLDAYEYQCSRGVRVSLDKAGAIRGECEKHGTALSVHAPYYISLSSQEPGKQLKTLQYITDTAAAADRMGAKRVVVHAGALLGMERDYAVESACRLLKRAVEELDRIGLSHIVLCPETMGKLNQLGDSREIIRMCRMDPRLLPAIDFGHLYCRGLGRPVTKDDWKRELTLYLDGLGYERMKHFHSHFSKMEYTLSGGEKCHVTFAETDCGPDFSEVCRALTELGLDPVVICESAGTQDMDSREMKNLWREMRHDN